MAPSHHKYKNSAAFYDVDGTLIRINIVHTFSYYAQRQPSLLESLKRTVTTAASIPLFWAADKVSRKWFNEIFYRSYEGASQDRLVTLSSSERQRVLRASRAAEERARAIREALARKAAQESADKYTRD